MRKSEVKNLVALSLQTDYSHFDPLDFDPPRVGGLVQGRLHPVGYLLTLRQDLCQALRTQNIPAYITELFRNSHITEFSGDKNGQNVTVFRRSYFIKKRKTLHFPQSYRKGCLCIYVKKIPAHIKEKQFAVMSVHPINICPTFS
jgi:hypothetical protein